ncbi:MAG: hypothetical protein KatS3mg054_1454 [Chloroflexus sp.]|nr:MAG: hypothetical protein KatS3mg054_1454 [Chloroflexus sp.]
MPCPYLVSAPSRWWQPQIRRATFPLHTLWYDTPAWIWFSGRIIHHLWFSVRKPHARTTARTGERGQRIRLPVHESGGAGWQPAPPARTLSYQRYGRIAPAKRLVQ